MPPFMLIRCSREAQLSLPWSMRNLHSLLRRVRRGASRGSKQGSCNFATISIDRAQPAGMVGKHVM